MNNDVLKKQNEELEAKTREAIYDLEKAQSVAKIGSWVYGLKNNRLRWSKDAYLFQQSGLAMMREIFKFFKYKTG